MKVVIFCGGMGVRMGEATQQIPKPMIPVGSQPILWHIMKWYASWGHTDFVLCLGYRADVIKQYFLSYHEALANDFVLAGPELQLLATDMDDWRITFLDTGIHATLADRLVAAKKHIGDDPVFLATYGDGLTDAPLDHMIEMLVESGKTGLIMTVRPRLSYHVVSADGSGIIRAITPIRDADVRINAGFFVFRSEIFDELRPGEELMEEPIVRLAERGDVCAYPYDGFWEPMDTIKDKQKLDSLVENGLMPWRARHG